MPTASGWCTDGSIATRARLRGSAGLGNIKGYVNPPHYSKFSILDRETNVVLRGTPDGILVMQDGSHLIVDYKTAKFTAHQDELFPMYEVQLNAYAVIGEQKGFAPVSGLALVYTEPVTDDATAKKDANQTGLRVPDGIQRAHPAGGPGAGQDSPAARQGSGNLRPEAPSPVAEGLQRLRPAARPHRPCGRVD